MQVPASPADLPAATDALWLQRFTRGLVLLDLLVLCSAGVLAVAFRFGAEGSELRGLSYYAVAGLVVLAWMATLGLSRCYEARFVGTGPEEFKRVFNACVRVVAGIGVIAFAGQLDVARGFIGILVPLGSLLLLLGRFAARSSLHRRRREGRASHRVLVVGTYLDVRDLVQQLNSEPLAGLRVVGACTTGDVRVVLPSNGPPVPVIGGLTSVIDATAAVQADTIAVAASPLLRGEALRRLSYELEGTGVDLLVSPALTNVTGTRISIRPVAGLPLLHLDEPELAGSRQLIKSAFDRTVSATALLLAAPLLLGIALAVRLTSPGPALFTQTRVGRRGDEFTVLKFRSMTDGAEGELEGLRHLNEHDGVLFKLRDDPRVTSLGTWLRKWSLDELPQLINVVKGEMSLVGPRPPLPSEVAKYEGHAHRRLLVKPGITGLWQVSGRSDLSWEETIRLDLSYVENWSLGLDLSVLAKTVASVVRRSGAY